MLGSLVSTGGAAAGGVVGALSAAWDCSEAFSPQEAKPSSTPVKIVSVVFVIKVFSMFYKNTFKGYNYLVK
ncbi:hypothetical protein GCM10023188_20860 [Pontibacter saemangeumensis]|uniref:Uncharacterized protein n=1 Tax=Pontibacter saemangeumensis TaxID=1084525 RepID=A0ABP8LM88_9BACT